MRRRIRIFSLGLFLMTMTISTHSLAEDLSATGASLAWTTSDPVVKQAIALLDAGKFADAQTLLATDDGHADPAVAQAREEMKDLIGRLRREYSLDEAGLLAKVRKSIPDVTADDLTKWHDAGQLQARTVDGQLLYFRREPSNLFRFCDEAKERAKKGKGDPDKVPDWRLIDHLKQVVAEAESTGKTDVMPVRHKVEYTLTVPGNSADVRKGSLVRLWLPYPQEYRQQKDIKFLGATLNGAKYDPQIAPNASDDGHDTVGGAPQRTAYFETRVDEPAKPVVAKLEVEFTSYAYCPKLDPAMVKPLPTDWNGAYLGERLPHIAFTPKIKETVAKVVGDESNPLLRARKIFHWVDESIRYHAQEEYCVVPGLSDAAFTHRRGDCGVQATLFVTMCRIAGIPARWQSGWESKPSGWNMHDWSEIYVAPWGWLPCDASYGVQKSDDPRVADFYLGHQDSYRMIVNLDYGRPLCPPKQSLRSEPADFQRGEVEIDGKNLYFDDWDYEMKFWVDGKPI
jgi:transglutaminase-like putative cysteine protease